MKRIGDRFDGKLLKDVDSLHLMLPFLYPGRCNNEAYVSEMIDLTAAEAFLKKKNKENDGYHYTTFQLIVTAILKTLMLRPRLNRFIVHGSMYHRYEKSVAFTVKKQFNDTSEEGLAFVNAEKYDTLDTIHDKIYKQIYDCREGSGDAATNNMDLFNRMPYFLGKNMARAACFLGRRSLLPKCFVAGDPGYASVFLSNLGSIGMKSGYHHLSEWGTNSIFVVVGKIQKRPLLDKNGKTRERLSVDLGLTIDERIADGYYYSRSVKLLKYLLEHPEELEKPIHEHLTRRSK